MPSPLMKGASHKGSHNWLDENKSAVVCICQDCQKAQSFGLDRYNTGRYKTNKPVMTNHA